jgi:succinoglycan biosynthesis transport protein ExoP
MSIPPSLSVSAFTEKRWEPETLLWVAWQRKWLILVGGLLGLAVGAVLGTVLPRVYQSSAQISIIKKSSDTVTGVDTRHIAAEENISPPQDLLKSSLIIDRAIQSRGLGSLATIHREDEELTDSIKNALTVIPGKSGTGPSHVFKLNFRAGDADESRAVLNALLDSFREHMDAKHQAISKDTFELILREKKTLEEKMIEQDTAYRAFREKAPLLGKGKDGMELRQERLNTIQAKRSALLLQRVELEGQHAALEAAQKAGRGQDAILAMLIEFTRKNENAEAGRDRQVGLQDQLFPLLLEERKLIQTHGANHPDVAALRNRIEVVRRLLVLPPSAWKSESDLMTPGIDPIALHVQMLTQKLDHNKISEELLAKIFKTEQDEARHLSAYEIQNDAFQTSSSLNQKLYEALVRRLNEVGLIRNVGGYQIELIEPPSLGKRVAPSMTLALLLGAFLGIGLGLGSAYWTDYRDTRFRSKNEITRSLGLHVLGSIPRVNSLRQDPIATGAVESEAFWKIRNTLCLLAEKGGPKVIQVVAPNGGDGASTVASNLSVTLAQSGKRVLLVDAHLSDGASQTNIHDSGLADLSMASTSAVGFKDFVASVRDRFDFVIIDSPAILATADASAMVRSADAAVLTIDYTRTTRPQAERATQLLASAGVKVLGVVINAAKE